MARGQPRPHPPEDADPLAAGSAFETPGAEPETLEPPPPAQPERVRVPIGGREYEVEPELAEALRAREQEYERGFTRQGREVGDLRRELQELRQQVRPQQPAERYDYGQRVFEAPGEAFERAIQEAEERAYRRVRGEYTQIETEKRLWDRFYRENPDLAESKRLVQGIVAEHQQEGVVGQFYGRPDDYLELLAKEARREKLALIRQAREADAPEERLTGGHARVEGGSRRQPPPATTEEPPLTLAGLQRSGRSRREAAQRRYEKGE